MNAANQKFLFLIFANAVAFLAKPALAEAPHLSVTSRPSHFQPLQPWSSCEIFSDRVVVTRRLGYDVTLETVETNPLRLSERTLTNLTEIHASVVDAPVESTGVQVFDAPVKIYKSRDAVLLESAHLGSQGWQTVQASTALHVGLLVQFLDAHCP